MDLKIISLHRVGVQAAFLLLVACGSSPEKEAAVEQEAVDQPEYFVGKKPVYATMVSSNGGAWLFDKVTHSNLPPKKGYLVRLNDLAPAFDTRTAECTPQSYPTGHKCSPTHPFRNKDVGVISKIISGGIAAGTAGKVTDVSRTYETAFDEPAFNQAVDEALVNSNLDRERHDLLASLEIYATLIDSGRKSLADLRRNRDAIYRDTSAVQLDIQPSISGLTEYFTNDLNYRELVQLVPKSATSESESELSGKELLPCDARLCAQNARVEIASARAKIERSKMSLMTEGNQTYDVRCDSTQHAGYLLRMNCPTEIVRSPVGPATLPVSLNILARDFVGLYPSIGLDDDQLAVEIDAGVVTFKNRTTGYLSVSAQTVYYNSEMHTTTEQINLAPGAVTARNLEDFVSSSIAIEANYLQMTPGKADSSTFDFGFAIQYGGAGIAAETTLYDKREFNVGCVIDNRIQAGSCIESRIEKIQANEGPPVPY